MTHKAFPPDVRLFPDCDKYDISTMTNEYIQHYIFSVCKNDQYAPEAYSFNFSDTTGEYLDVLVGSIPESKSGVTGECIHGLMFEVEKLVSRHDLPLIGHCTDSASNSLSGLKQQASPGTYTGLDKTLHRTFKPWFSILCSNISCPISIYYLSLLRSLQS